METSYNETVASGPEGLSATDNEKLVEAKELRAHQSAEQNYEQSYGSANPGSIAVGDARGRAVADDAVPAASGFTVPGTDNQVQSPVIAHSDPTMHITRDVDGLPVPHPAEQPRHVIERALGHTQKLSADLAANARATQETMPVVADNAYDRPFTPEGEVPLAQPIDQAK